MIPEPSIKGAALLKKVRRVVGVVITYSYAARIIQFSTSHECFQIK